MKFPFTESMPALAYLVCITEARRILTDDVKPYDLTAEVITEYRRHRRRGSCPCQAMAAAAWDWDC